MGWAILLGLALLVGVGLWRFGHLPRASLELLGAALLLGIAGYAVQGSPYLPGRPTPPKASSVQPGADFAKSPAGMLASVGSAVDVMNAAQSWHERGLDGYALAIIRDGLGNHPRNADLWVDYGNALVVYADGLISPAARLAFERAAKLDPSHPGPPYFLGLAYAQAGQVEQAINIWQALLDRSAPGAAWRPEVEQRLAELYAMQGQAGAPPATPGQVQ